jgi:hypothetical protein
VKRQESINGKETHVWKHEPVQFSVNALLKERRFYSETLGLEMKEIAEGLELRIPVTFTILNFESRIRAGDSGRATDLKAVVA